MAISAGIIPNSLSIGGRTAVAAELDCGGAEYNIGIWNSGIFGGGWRGSKFETIWLRTDCCSGRIGGGIFGGGRRGSKGIPTGRTGGGGRVKSNGADSSTDGRASPVALSPME